MSVRTRAGGRWCEATLCYTIGLFVPGPRCPKCIFDEEENMVCERLTDYRMVDSDRRCHGIALG